MRYNSSKRRISNVLTTSWKSIVINTSIRSIRSIRRRALSRNFKNSIINLMKACIMWFHLLLRITENMMKLCSRHSKISTSMSQIYSHDYTLVSLRENRIRNRILFGKKSDELERELRNVQKWACMRTVILTYRLMRNGELRSLNELSSKTSQQGDLRCGCCRIRVRCLCYQIIWNISLVRR